MEAVRVVFRPRSVVYEAIARKPRPLAPPGIFIGLELDKEEGDRVLLRRRLAFPDEIVRLRMFARRVVKHHDISAFRVQNAIR